MKNLYSELVRIIEKKDNGSFQNWLDNNLNESEFEDVYELYMSVSQLDRFGIYDTHEDEDMIIVKSDVSNDELKLHGREDQTKFLCYLDDTYGGDIGVVALYDFNKAIEKDD